MSDINEETIRALAKLCRLEVSSEELPRLSADLKRILQYIDQLAEVDLTHLTSHGHAEEMQYADLREDEVKEVLPRDLFLANAPDRVGGMIRVPTVIKHV